VYGTDSNTKILQLQRSDTENSPFAPRWDVENYEPALNFSSDDFFSGIDLDFYEMDYDVRNYVVSFC